MPLTVKTEGESEGAPGFITGRFDDRSAWSKYKYYFVIPDTHSVVRRLDSIVIPDLIGDFFLVQNNRVKS